MRRLHHVGARAWWWRRLVGAGYGDEKVLNLLFKASFDAPDRRRAAVEWMKTNGHRDEHLRLAHKLGLDNLTMMGESLVQDG